MMDETATASRYPINGFQRGSWGRFPSESRTGEEPVRRRPRRPPSGQCGAIKSTIDAYCALLFMRLILSFKPSKVLDSCKRRNCLSPSCSCEMTDVKTFNCGGYSFEVSDVAVDQRSTRQTKAGHASILLPCGSVVTFLPAATRCW